MCNKSVESRVIFYDRKDCNRFLRNITAINYLDLERPGFLSNFDMYPLRTGNKRLVKIYAVSLIPNHFHLLLEQKQDNGITNFMQRLCNAYAKYFNIKHNRSGTLFAGPFKAILIENDVQAKHIFSYIHANPLDLIEPHWREGKIKKLDPS